MNGAQAGTLTNGALQHSTELRDSHPFLRHNITHTVKMQPTLGLRSNFGMTRDGVKGQRTQAHLHHPF